MSRQSYTTKYQGDEKYCSVAPANKSEKAFWELCQENGWKSMRRGWPDFFVELDGKIIFVEVKKSRYSKLKVNQLYLMKQMKKMGIDCYFWSPDDGFQSINEINENGYYDPSYHEPQQGVKPKPTFKRATRKAQ